jgi:ComF family protein
VAPLRYESWSKNLIHRFKFERDLRAGHYLASCLAEAVATAYSDQPLPQLLLPVPLHTQRLYHRGFNQAIEIAQTLARQFSLPLARESVTRHKNSVDQIGLSALARRRNVRGVFALAQLLPAHIAIIDDVVTTGATVLELAKCARQHGAEQIDVWCVARTVK